MRRKQPAFLMADSLVALVIVALGVNLVFLCEHQLIKQQQNEQLKLAAARLGKEASDQYMLTKQKVDLKRPPMRVQADDSGIRVDYYDQPLLRVRP